MARVERLSSTRPDAPGQTTSPALLTLDVGNRLTSIAVWRTDADCRRYSITTEADRTEDELRVLLGNLLEADIVAGAEAPTPVVAACVVPGIGRVLAATLRRLTGSEPLFVGPGVRTGMVIRTDDPREVGPDRVANAVAAAALSGSPVIVIDISTAMTLDVVGPGSEYLGTVIAPGPDIGLATLTRRAAGLTGLDLTADRPARAIANNTADALRAGIVLGSAATIDGLLVALRDSVGACPVLATGDSPSAARIIQACTEKIDFDPLLTHRGLRIIGEINAVDIPRPASGRGGASAGQVSGAPPAPGSNTSG